MTGKDKHQTVQHHAAQAGSPEIRTLRHTTPLIKSNPDNNLLITLMRSDGNKKKQFAVATNENSQWL
ncbi:hypothetical protein LDO48_08815 [Pantoea agglomerans]|jgi:hypothetical protein|nr:hypothetical protein [Pantoea agglomerans]